jgi:hypothetical protein
MRLLEIFLVLIFMRVFLFNSTKDIECDSKTDPLFRGHEDLLEQSAISLFSNPSIKFSSVYDPWEASICWDDVDVPIDSSSQRKINKRLRRMFPQNRCLEVGQWVDGIVWDESVAEGMEPDSDRSRLRFADFARLVDTSSSSRLHDEVQCREEESDDCDDCDEDNHYIPEIMELNDAYSFIRECEVSSRVEELDGVDQKANTGNNVDTQNKGSDGMDSLSELPAPLTQVLTVQQRLDQLEREKVSRLGPVLGGMFNAENTTEASDASKQVVLSSRRKRTTAAEEELEHSTFAARHLNTVPILSPLQLKYFHRPLLSKQALSSTLHNKPNIWHIIVEKKGKHKLTASQGNLRRTHNSTKQISSAAELSLIDDTSEYICIEYVEENPNLIMNRGMASKIVNYYRPMEDEEDASGDEEDINGSGLAVGNALPKDNNNITMNRRIPRHLQQLKTGSVGVRAFGKGVGGGQGAIGDIDIPKLTEGVTEVLEEDDTFPFLGEISPGAPPQPTVHCDLFRSPLFRHDPKTTDFLLVRKSMIGSSSGSFQFVLKKLPSLFTAGQQEPLKEVLAPKKKKKTLTPFQNKFLAFHITKYFESHSDINERDVQKLFKYFWEKYKTETRKILRSLGDEMADDDECTTWVKKAPLTAKQIQKMQTRNHHIPLAFSEFEHAFSPEEVCTYESGTSAESRLSLLGINYFMTQKDLEQALQRLHNVKKFKTKRHLKLRKLIRSVTKDHELKRFAPKSFKTNKTGVELSVEQRKSADDEFTERIRNLTLLKDIIEVELKRLKDKINVARYIYQVCMLTPWVMTSSFIKYHIEEQNKNTSSLKNFLTTGGVVAGNRGGIQKYSGLLKLTGIPGDPSGVGEGYSYLASVTSKKAAPKKDKGDSTTSSTATIVGTGKDLRVLTMKDLETLCLQLGASREEVKILKRWDRVKFVEIAATKAKKMGVAKHLWRYARDEGEGVQNIEEYRETCISIWNRQMHALRDFSWDDAEAQETEFKDECMRRLNRKQRREENIERRRRREARSLKLERRKARAIARAAGEEISDSEDDKGEEVKDIELEKEDEDEDDKSIEVSDSSPSSDSESESDLEDDLNSDDDDDNDDDDDDDAESTSDDPVPVAAVASQRTKRAMRLAKQRQSQEEKDLKYFEKLNNNESAPSSGGGGSSSTVLSQNAVEETKPQSSREDHERFWNEIRRSGGKVVKHVKRYIMDDGTEKIEVRFIVHDEDVERVLRNERLAGNHERRSQQQREEDIAKGITPRKRIGNFLSDFNEPNFDSGGKRKGRRSLDHDDYEDELDGESTGLTLKVGIFRNRAEKHTNKVAREREAEESMYERDFAAVNKKARTKARQSRGSSYIQRCISKQRNSRLPHVLLASNLEMIWHSIFVKKDASWFRFPVDLTRYPDYTRYVQQPMSLQDIREKIVSYSYHTVEAFVNDLKLIVSNCAKYNREDNKLTQIAAKLVDNAIQLLAAEGGGDSKDSYGFFVQENDIKTLYARVGRAFHTAVHDVGTRPDVIDPNILTSDRAVQNPAKVPTGSVSATQEPPSNYPAIDPTTHEPRISSGIPPSTSF